jgi:glutaredoxin
MEAYLGYPVVVFSKQGCKYCNLLLDDLEKLNIPYQKFDITNNIRLRDQLVNYTNVKTVPQIFIMGKFLGGYNEFAGLVATRHLDKLLAGANLIADYTYYDDF